MTIDIRKLQKFSDHIYWLPPDDETDRPILGVVAGEQSSIVIEAGASVQHAQLLLDQIEPLALAPIRYLFLTHWHWDHVFGTDAFRVPTFASKLTQDIVREMVSLDWSDAALDERVAAGTEIAFCRDMMKLELPDRSDLIIRPPDIAFETSMTVDLGGVHCQLIYVGGDHAADASIAFIPEEKVVFLSDCLYYDLYHDPIRYTVEKIVLLYERVLSLDADFYFWGHDSDVMSRETLLQQQEMMAVYGRLTQTHTGNPTAIKAALTQTHPQLINDETDGLIAAFCTGYQTE